MKRKLDKCGRPVIPMEYRRELDLKDGDLVEIEMIDDKIVISKAEEKEDFKDELISMLEDIIDARNMEQVHNIIEMINDNL